MNGFNQFYPFYKQSGFLAGLKGKINWSGILNGTQKTLNIVNQAIPLVYQVRPIIDNAKTVFKVIGAVKDDGKTVKKASPPTPTRTTTNNSNVAPRRASTEQNFAIEQNQPNFFL